MKTRPSSTTTFLPLLLVSSTLPGETTLPSMYTVPSSMRTSVPFTWNTCLSLCRRVVTTARFAPGVRTTCWPSTGSLMKIERVLPSLAVSCRVRPSLSRYTCPVLRRLMVLPSARDCVVSVTISAL